MVGQSRVQEVPDLLRLEGRQHDLHRSCLHGECAGRLVVVGPTFEGDPGPAFGRRRSLTGRNCPYGGEGDMVVIRPGAPVRRSSNTARDRTGISTLNRTGQAGNPASPDCLFFPIGKASGEVTPVSAFRPGGRQPVLLSYRGRARSVRDESARRRRCRIRKGAPAA